VASSSVCLRAAGRKVYAINPIAVSRYRDRHSAVGKKSDVDAALMLAEILHTDMAAIPTCRHRHPPGPVWPRGSLCGFAARLRCGEPDEMYENSSLDVLDGVHGGAAGVAVHIRPAIKTGWWNPLGGD
jgi:hypothetical protein